MTRIIIEILVSVLAHIIVIPQTLHVYPKVSRFLLENSVFM